MGPMQAILSGVMTIFFLPAMVVALVWKVFQVSTDLGEIKALLIQMRSATPAPVPVPDRHLRRRQLLPARSPSNQAERCCEKSQPNPIPWPPRSVQKPPPNHL